MDERRFHDDESAGLSDGNFEKTPPCMMGVSVPQLAVTRKKPIHRHHRLFSEDMRSGAPPPLTGTREGGREVGVP